MKIFLIALAGLFLAQAAQADLLDLLQLEDTLKIRIESALQGSDPKARALVRIELKKFSTSLPGTSIETNLTPTKIEAGDISKVNVDVFTELKEIPADVKQAILQTLPVPQDKVVVKLRAYKTGDVLVRFDPSGISEIADRSVSTMSKNLMFLALSAVILFSVFLFIQSLRSDKQFREQVQMIAKAISENAGGTGPAMPLPQQTTTPATAELTKSANEASDSLDQLSIASLQELFADCYWTEQDGYASWLWKKLSAEKQAKLYEAWPQMREYSLYFVNVPAQAMSYHEHPYYLQPGKFQTVSQADLSQAINEDLSRWHQVGPFRQQFLVLDLKSKMDAVQSPPSSKGFSLNTKSEARKLKSVVRWGDVSAEDEMAIHTNPEMVPQELRENIRSLVWLAQKDSETITKALAKFDARSLASCWIGPDEVLTKLEQHLPEKKLKFLQTYKGKTPVSRASPVFQALVEEGLKSNAA